jgi:hypothetical protein
MNPIEDLHGFEGLVEWQLPQGWAPESKKSQKWGSFPNIKNDIKFRDLTKGKCFERQRINLKSLLWWIRVSPPYGCHTWCIGINMRNPNLSI